MEITALNEMVKRAQEKESKAQEKHKHQLERLRVTAQERVDKANEAVVAAEQARLWLQHSVTTQLSDANKRYHQAEAKTEAVCRPFSTPIGCEWLIACRWGVMFACCSG